MQIVTEATFTGALTTKAVEMRQEGGYSVQINGAGGFTMDSSLEHSNDGDTWQVVENSAITGKVVGDVPITYEKSHNQFRYLRVVLNVTGTINDLEIHVTR